MIVVKVELWPGGDKTKSRSLGTAVIVNDGDGSDTERNYDIRVFSKGTKPRCIKSGRLEKWRSKSVSAWKTVMACLNKAFN